MNIMCIVQGYKLNKFYVYFVLIIVLISNEFLYLDIFLFNFLNNFYTLLHNIFDILLYSSTKLLYTKLSC